MASVDILNIFTANKHITDSVDEDNKANMVSVNINCSGNELFDIKLIKKIYSKYDFAKIHFIEANEQ